MRKGSRREAGTIALCRSWIFFGVPATSRASFAFYNTKTEIDALVKALSRVYEVFGK